MQIKRSNPRRRAVTGRSALPLTMQQRAIKSCLLHVPSTPSPLSLPISRSHPSPAFSSPSPLPPIRTSLRCLFSVSRVHRMHFYSIPFFFSFQMVQAIQVLRFHLLELEKVSILHVCITWLHNVITDPMIHDICAMHYCNLFLRYPSLSFYLCIVFSIEKKLLSKLLQPHHISFFFAICFTHISIFYFQLK